MTSAATSGSEFGTPAPEKRDRTEPAAATTEPLCPGCGRPVSECQAEDVGEAKPAASSSRLLPNSHRWDTEVWRAIRALRNERSALVARIAYLDDLMERLVGRRDAG